MAKDETQHVWNINYNVSYCGYHYFANVFLYHQKILNSRLVLKIRGMIIYLELIPKLVSAYQLHIHYSTTNRLAEPSFNANNYTLKSDQNLVIKQCYFAFVIFIFCINDHAQIIYLHVQCNG